MGSPFAAGTEPSSVAVDSQSKFVYAANDGSNNISAYAINATTGALTQVAGSPFGAGDEPAGVSTCRVKADACIPAQL